MPPGKPIEEDFEEPKRTNPAENDERETVLFMIGPIPMILPNPFYKPKKEEEEMNDV